ncbi:unnamed protein product [Rotaria socialis]|uniref:Uncharacterized protein n=1 Tax=Rotaria socialis TaxID=392032 RepID=A0A820AGD8_9BILA|nr:unnamed protein product [Rotaria socialis]CAF3373467.1 unnamed protein product [Rotaria socialis]CAF4192831.1 unnamed protein product [Rotaria socialis]CAF4492072.1 unnamed protein product [Rotaria socialis]
MCRYLSQIDILDSLLNLNNRVNKTITTYREKIFISHLSHKDFFHLINNHLPYLSANVSYLYINNCSMLNSGKLFEEKFNKVDQQFPLLQELVFHQIDIETLENLSWRFNTMYYLHTLTIDIAEDRLSSMPVQFDEFICGKLFTESNSFKILKLYLNKYKFSLYSLKKESMSIKQLTISVQCLKDLLIVFNSFPNLEKLNITIGCSSSHDINNDTYPYERLWWKVPYLTHFDLKIEEEELTSHDYVIPQDTIVKIIENLYALSYFKFTLNIRFHATLQTLTTKDIYMDKYFPYADGSLWQKALNRNDDRTINFALHFELDGITIDRLKKTIEPNVYTTAKYDDIDFNSLLRETFSSAYWLQKNIIIQCLSTNSKHVSIYTLPITNTHLSTTADIIDQELSMNASMSYKNIQSLLIYSETEYHSPKLSITNIFNKFPSLTHLQLDTVLLLPPKIFICSLRLRSLSLCNYSLLSCCQLLEYLPKVISLTITTQSKVPTFDFWPKPILSVTRLKLSIDSGHTKNLLNIPKYFPNVNEFYLRINNTLNRSVDDFCLCEKFECFSKDFIHLRYFEITLPIKQESMTTSKWMTMLQENQTMWAKNKDGSSVTLKIWL